MGQPKIIVLDLETAPNIAHVWSLFKVNVGLEQIVSDDSILSYAWKYLGEPEVYTDDASLCFLQGTPKEKSAYRAFIQGLASVLDQADIVIAHNGAGFDVPWVIGQCVEHNVKPPSPFKIIDTLTQARKSFRLPSYKLDYLTRRFGLKKKSAHSKFPGHQLWAQCLKGNPDAWKELVTYNANDVVILEELYLRIRPYLKGHVNVGVYLESEDHVCPTCGGKHLHRRGYYHSNLSKFQRFVCTDCGTWSRSRFNLIEPKARKALLTPAI